MRSLGAACPSLKEGRAEPQRHVALPGYTHPPRHEAKSRPRFTLMSRVLTVALLTLPLCDDGRHRPSPASVTRALQHLESLHKAKGRSLIQHTMVLIGEVPETSGCFLQGTTTNIYVVEHSSESFTESPCLALRPRFRVCHIKGPPPPYMCMYVYWGVWSTFSPTRSPAYHFH